MADGVRSRSTRSQEGLRSRLGRVRAELGALVEAFDARLVDAHTAADLVQDFAVIERLAAAGRALSADRVAATRVWAEQGDRTAAHWLARTSGSSVGQAIATLETARRLESLDGTAEALRTGALSLDQAEAISRAATVDPAAEADLLSVAARADVAELREECRRVKAAAQVDEVARDAAVRRSRYARQWVDDDGAWRMSVRDTVGVGARLWAALEAESARLRREAPMGARDACAPDEARRADALAGLVDAGHRVSRAGHRTGADDGARATVHVRVDHAALVRGHSAPGEVCEIPGIGPVPVVTARALAADAYVSVLVTRGAEVVAVAHAGRTIRANVRRALVERSPTCEVPGCAVRDGLEIDHVTGYAVTRDTRLDDLARLCPWHHHLKTHHRYRLGGPPDAREWIPPAALTDPDDGGRGRAPPGRAAA